MRFATAEQISKINGLTAQITAYKTVFGILLNSLAGYIEAYEATFPNPASIEIRYITSEGRDDERWRGNLLSASPNRNKVNVWLITLTMLEGKSLQADEPIGSFSKPVSIGIDYFYDWDYGTDTNNSEDFFNKKIQGFDFILEQIRSCLPNGADIESWLFRLMIKQFTNASTHIAKGDLAIRFEGL